MLNKVVMAFGAAFGTALLAALGIDIYEHHKVSKKIDVATGNLKTASVKEIQDGIVESAVKAAADDKVASYMRGLHNQVMDDANSELTKAAKKAVDDASIEIKTKVGDKISELASKIDISELEKSARDKAEAKILEKFDGNLDDLLVKFNDNLSNVQKIYGGIADAISKGQEQSKGLKFTIGS